MQDILVLSIIPVTALVTILIGKRGIDFLHQLKFGQHIREEGPASHHAKSGTPTMGGLLFLLPVLLITALFSQLNLHTLVIITLVLLTAGIGFLDDFLIIYFKNNKGITPRQKLLGQASIGLLLGIYLQFFYQHHPYTEIPFLAHQFTLGWLFIPFTIFFFVSTTNAVNLTDGLDGLATSVTIICVTSLTLILQTQYGIANPDYRTVIMLGLATIGGGLGFLWFNAHPAQVFMGDTGSLALGGILALMAIMGHLEVWFVFIGLTFVLETLSVVIQVVYFKRTRKRFFRMSPLHHHFELSGWKETQVVNRFCIASILFSIVSIISYYFCHNMI